MSRTRSMKSARVFGTKTSVFQVCSAVKSGETPRTCSQTEIFVLDFITIFRDHLSIFFRLIWVGIFCVCLFRCVRLFLCRDGSGRTGEGFKCRSQEGLLSGLQPPIDIRDSKISDLSQEFLELIGTQCSLHLAKCLLCTRKHARLKWTVHAKPKKAHTLETTKILPLDTT